MADNNEAKYVYVFYDVPTDCKKLYYRIRNILWGKAAPVQRSVYVLPLAEKERVERLMAEAQDITGQRTSLSFTLVHPASNDEVQVMVRSALITFCADMGKRIRKAVAAAKEKNALLSGVYCKGVEKKLEGIRRLSVIFNVAQDVDAAYKAVSDLWQVESVIALNAAKAIVEGNANGEGTAGTGTEGPGNAREGTKGLVAVGCSQTTGCKTC